MALHTELPIHKTGCKLLSLAVTAQVQMPRTVKRLMGDKITSHCIEMLDLMAMANASQKAERAALIRELLKHVRASYMGLLRQASHSHTDRARLANALMARGHCVKSDLTKIYRKASA
jgi:hypothetical protein